MADVKEEQINQLIEKYSAELSEDQIRALPLISFGMSAARVSKITNVSATTIRQWMRTDSLFRSALSEFQDYTNLYHMAMLNQAGSLAWDRVFEILESEYDSGDKVGRINQAQMAKFIVAELNVMGNKPEEQKEPEIQLHISESSADLIARRVAEIQDDKVKTVDATYTIEPPNKNDPRQINNSMQAATEIDSEFLEVQQAVDEPIYPKHPNTKYGELSYNDNKTKIYCHICGKLTTDLVIHIRNEHRLNPNRYRTMYKIPPEVKFGLLAPVPADIEDITEYNKTIEETE